MLFRSQRLEIILAVTTAPTVPEWPSYGNFCMVNQNPHFLKKWKGGTKENFSKIAQKNPPFERPKTILAERHYPLFSMHLKNKDWERFWRKKLLKECRNGQVMANFARSPKTRIFRKSANGGPREIFKKSAKK